MLGWFSKFLIPFKIRSLSFGVIVLRETSRVFTMFAKQSKTFRLSRVKIDFPFPTNVLPFFSLLSEKLGFTVFQNNLLVSVIFVIFTLL